ncbi:MAG: butyrate kinase [Planctomycetes bacterium]|nr:butyrate kinase [Planctomycetota bacterium]
MKAHIVLAINPGSTSTKIAVFRGEERVLSENIFHGAEALSAFGRITDQHGFRKTVILDLLKEKAFDLRSLSAVVGRGGMLTPMDSGTYIVDEGMVAYLKDNPVEHASNLGAILAKEIADSSGRKAYIVDPIVVDEMEEAARITGIPEIRRLSIFHALNQKAAAREAARVLKKDYNETRLIVVHLGGGISVGAHRNGRVIDVNNALNGEGPMGPERAGSVPAWQLAEMVLSGRYGGAALRKMITGRGGLMAYLGTNDMREVKAGIKNGDASCKRVYLAMAYQVAKETGSMAAVLDGEVDAIVFTGGIAYDGDFLDLVKQKICFIAPTINLPGEDEMASLVKGVHRVLNGEEEEKRWKPSKPSDPYRRKSGAPADPDAEGTHAGRIYRLLNPHRDALIQAEIQGLRERHAPHYLGIDLQALGHRSVRLINAFLSSLEEGPVHFVRYIDRIAEERFSEGYFLEEIQIALNILAEKVWEITLREVPCWERDKALARISGTVGAAKDQLARVYFKKMERSGTRMAWLEDRLNELSTGTISPPDMAE